MGQARNRPEISMLQIFLIGLGGATGAIGRHLVGQGAMRAFGFGFPYGTMIVNIVGSFAMGALIAWLTSRAATPNEVRLFFATGLLGGFTTFSAFSLDAVLLYERGELGLSVLYVVASVLVSILALVVGLWLVRSLA